MLAHVKQILTCDLAVTNLSNVAEARLAFVPTAKQNEIHVNNSQTMVHEKLLWIFHLVNEAHYVRSGSSKFR